MIKLSKDSFMILKHCLQKYNPDLIPIIENPNISEYTSEFYNQLREIIGDEFINHGLKADSEPNQYGMILEKLIDEIGRLFLYKQKGEK